MSVATARALGVRMVVALALVVGALIAPAGLWAQGVTTAAVRGTITDEAGQPVAGAIVTLTGTESGQRYQTTTQTAGRFFVANVKVGNYQIEARAIGYRPVRLGHTLILGQVGDVTLRLPAAAVELSEITVTGVHETPLLSAFRTGPATSVSDSMVSRLPTLNRSFTDFFQTVPQVVGSGAGVSVAGGNARSNNIQIDGAVSNDLFALNSTDGMPGGRANARLISVDAIREFQVLIAPYDVRVGGFTGGLLNAITRSGTNHFSGSLFGYFQSNSWVGKDSAGGEAADFSQSNYGFTFGGPIIRDRLHFFVAAESRADERPFGGPNILSSDTINTAAQRPSQGITVQTADAVTAFSRDSLNFDPGTYAAPTRQNPNQNLFVKLDWQIGTNSHLEASYNYVDGAGDEFTRAPNTALSRFRDGYQLSNSGYQFQTQTQGWRAKWTTGIGSRASNELLISGTRIREPRILANQVPLLMVQGDVSGTAITAGGERSSQHNTLNQDVFELTDNLTLNFGRHIVTLGTQNQFFTFYNDFFQAAYGAWTFADTTALQTRAPNGYEIQLPFRRDTVGTQTATNPTGAVLCYGSYQGQVASGGTANPSCGPLVEIGVKQLGFYIQDQFSPTPRLTLTVGVRLDVPYLNDPPDYNRSLDSITAKADGLTCPADTLGVTTGAPCGGINTSSVPSGNAQFAPRMGINYDVHGDGSFYLRGGIGVFTGRPPYVFVTNAYGNTGVTFGRVACTTAGTIPTFAFDINNMPTQCAGAAALAPPAASVVFYDPSFRYPQDMRVTFGIDHRLPWEMAGTFDLMYRKSLNALYYNDVNLVAGGTSLGEANRGLYGTLSATSFSTTPRRRYPTTPTIYNDIIQHNNSDQDYQWSATVQLQKRFSRGMEFQASYNYSESYDLFSYGSDVTNSNMTNSPLVGTLANRELARSRFDIPHKVSLSGTANLPYGFLASLIYVGQSGRPYTYIVGGDVNADGYGNNDRFYVPANAQDISLCPATGSCLATTPTDPAEYARLDSYINGEACLRENRGQLVGRNTCRDAWQSFVNARVAKGVRLFGNQRIDFTMDIRNLMALMGMGGQVRTTSSFEAVNILSSQGYNTALSRPRYRLGTLPTRNRVNTTASRWQLMLGAKYSF